MPSSAEPSQLVDPQNKNGTNSPSTDILSNNGVLPQRKGPVLCVFCGSSDGNRPAHLAAARSLAQLMASNNISLVYGGGTVGLMGELARTLVSLRGPSSVHGIIPAALVKHEQKLTKGGSGNDATGIDPAIYGNTTVVKDMHTRKQLMAQEVIQGGKGGGFVALSGGYGTLEELMEITTWNQLGIHGMPVIMYNVDGYWDGLVQWVKTAVEHGFVAKNNEGIVVEAKTAEEVIQRIEGYKKAEGRFDLNWEEEG